MRINLALKNISDNKAKALLSIAGLGVAIILMFMQLGFRGAVENTATTIYEKMDFDLLVRSPNYLHLVAADRVPRTTLDEIAGQNQIAEVAPFHASLALWENPSGSISDQSGESATRGIVMIGIDPSIKTFQIDPRKGKWDLDQLTSSEYILIDQKSFPEYGPKNKNQFEREDIGVEAKVSGMPVKIAGLFKMGSGLTANGAMIVNEQGFDRLLPIDSRRFVSMGLIRLEQDLPERKRKEIARKLENRFRAPDGKPLVEVLTRREVYRRELKRWLGETPIGFVFTLGC